jgi:hypothetical protein
MSIFSSADDILRPDPIPLQPVQPVVVNVPPVLPPKVEGLRAVSGNTTIQLQWTRVTPTQPNGKPIQKYRIAYGTNPVQMDQSQDTTDPNPTFELKNLINGTRYFISILAVDSEGHKGQTPSDTVDATPKAPELPVEPEPASEAGDGVDIMEGLIYDPENKSRHHAFLALIALYYLYQTEKLHPHFINKSGYRFIDHFLMDISNVESILKAIFGTRRYEGNMEKDIKSENFVEMLYNKVLRLNKNATTEDILPIIDGLSDTIHKFDEIIANFEPEKSKKILDVIKEIKSLEGDGVVGADKITQILNAKGFELRTKKKADGTLELDIKPFNEALAQSMIRENEAQLHPARPAQPVEPARPNEAPNAEYEKAKARIETIVEKLADNDKNKAFELAFRINEINGTGFILLAIGTDPRRKARWLEEFGRMDTKTIETGNVSQRIMEIDRQFQDSGIYSQIS